MKSEFDGNRLTMYNRVTGYDFLSEEAFFEDRSRGIFHEKTLPMPDGVKNWYSATVDEIDVLAARAGDDLYLILESTEFGYSLHHYVCVSEDGSRFRGAYQRPVRVINLERGYIPMDSSLRNLANRGSIQNMSLNSQKAPEMIAQSEGIQSGSVESGRISREAMTKGFVAGYAMASAPMITTSIARKKGVDGTITASIVAKESKPSRCLRVMMALPARCVRRNGSLAEPEDIRAGAVDFNTAEPSEIIYQSFGYNAAIAYIGALGGMLPEYAPFVSNDARTQWTAEDILSGKPEVSFVVLRAIENKSKKVGQTNRFRFGLKSTSPRRSLYTPKNICCLRALEHVPTKCTTEQDAFKLNEIAFGAMRYRKPKTETKSVLAKALAECPSQIWETNYTIDGVEQKGIGSAFFMAGDVAKTPSGEQIAQVNLTYWPWWVTGSNRPAHGQKLQSIVKREIKPADGDKKERSVTCPVLLKDSPNHPMFKPYAQFFDFIINGSYITRDDLFSLNGRNAKAKSRGIAFTDEQKTSLANFLREDSVAAEIQSARDTSFDRVVLAEAQ